MSHDTSKEFATVRYQITDVERAIRFYTEHLGFEVQQRSGPAFAAITRGALRLVLGGPDSSGSRPMPDGRRQEPGGWNRIILYVDDLETSIASLRKAGAVFRNQIERGPGGSQIQIEDPDGNPIELHQPAK
jgi:catechol 2,3-dioxygenase-like lactoylglutathione lyase family enzyme